MKHEKYFIKGPEDRNTVEVWSESRLPFEPKGWQLDMRNSVKSAVKMMKAENDTMLHALFASDQEGFYDVENVLIYNVGSGTFANLCRKGLCFERKTSAPPKPSGGADHMPYYHRYSLMGLREKPLHWKKKNSLASWTGVKCPALRGENKPHSLWYAVKKGIVKIDCGLDSPRFFGLDIRINAPKGTVTNLANVVKPLLDGIISAFHAHDGTHNSVVVEHLARRLGEKETVIENMLMDRKNGVLGIRNLIHPFGKGVQWNPADDLCAAAKVLFNDCRQDASWSLDGEIFEVSPL